MQCGFSFACVLRLGAGSRKTQRPHNKSFKERKQVFKKRVRPLSRLQQAKNSQEGGRQSFSRAMLQNQKLLGAGVVRARPPFMSQGDKIYFEEIMILSFFYQSLLLFC